MNIIYNKDFHPFDEIEYISNYNQLIVRKKSVEDNDKKYVCNFHIHSNRGKIKTYISYGMDYLFNIDRGWYNITLDGNNENNFQIKFEHIHTDTSMNTNNHNNNKVELKQINFNIP